MFPSRSRIFVPAFLCSLCCAVLQCAPAAEVFRSRPEPGSARSGRVSEAPPDRLYMTNDGDTLALIARRFGVVGGYLALARRNDIRNPARICPGLMLRVPPREGRTETLRPFPVVRRHLRPLQPCGVRFGKPARALVKGCRKAYCAAGPRPDQRVCKCEYEPHRYRVTYAVGRTVYPLRRGDVGQGGLDRFHAVAADLDQDGTPELILAEHVASSNGIGLVWFEVGIYTPGRQAGPRLRFTSLAGDGLVVRRVGEWRCALLAADLEQQPGLWRGLGNFWTGRLYQYARGRLRPHPKALLRRERLGGPHPSRAERAAGRHQERLPRALTGFARSLSRAWVVGLSGEWWVRAGRPVKRVRARVERAVADAIVIRTGRTGRSVLRSLARWPSGHWGRRVGDRATGRLMPLNYRTADDAAYWKGAEVELVTYRAGPVWASTTILWR